MSTNLARLGAVAWTWGSTPEERSAHYPCDDYIDEPYRSIWRALDVEAPAAIMYRWLCQITLAPYSYDLLDNLGRRSPRHLVPGAGHLEVGQQLLSLATIVECEVGRQITVTMDRPSVLVLYLPMTVTYRLEPTGPASCRLAVKANIGGAGGWAGARRVALVWGDLVMMRKQLVTLKALAERTARDAHELALMAEE